MPLWHWGGLSNKVKAAQVEANVKRLELDDAKEKIALQISQAAFSYQEAFKTYDATKANLAQADENLRIADIAFKEGMGTIDEVLAAQTAWLKANSEKIDAEINVQLTHEFLTTKKQDITIWKKTNRELWSARRTKRCWQRWQCLHW